MRLNVSSPEKNVPRLLVSVRNAEEVVAAVEGGADWIDLKEPLAGPLGAVTAKVAKQVLERVAGCRPVSAALGELLDWPNASAQKLLDLEGIGVVKLGLAGCRTQNSWQRLWQAAADQVADFGKTLVAVAYADWSQAQAPSPQEVLACTGETQGRYLLIDTFDKLSGSLFEHLSTSELQTILCLAKRASIQTVVAGGLLCTTLDQLPEEGVDLVAARGGVCDGDRTGLVRQHLVADFYDAIHERWPV